jgi:hypothetical protein
MNTSNQQYTRISFCSDSNLLDLSNRASVDHEMSRSLLIRSVLFQYLQKNHSNLIGSIL